MKRSAKAGFTAIETSVASTFFLVLMYGVVIATGSFTKATTESRNDLSALSRAGRAIECFSHELTKNVVLDPKNGIQILTATGTRVPDMNVNQPVSVTGPVLRVERRGEVRLTAGTMTSSRYRVDFQKDTSADLNGDGRTDQFLRIETPAGAATPTYSVLAEQLIDVAFTKFGDVVKIECRSRGAIKNYLMVGGQRVPEYTEIVQIARVRPRNF